MNSAHVRRHPVTHVRLLCGIGILVVLVLVVCGVDVVALVAVSGAIVAGNWLVAPVVVQRIMRTRVVPNDGHGYLALPGSAQERVGRIVARRCAAAGVSLVRLEFVDIDEPNAFTYGRSARAPRLVVTTGLVSRLSDDELDAVICHELGHIHHRDVVLLTLLSVIPALCYLAARALIDMEAGDVDGDGDGDGDDDEGGLVILAVGFFVLYAVTEVLLLGVSRSREYDADVWASDQMGRAEPLVSALITVTHAAEATRGAWRPASSTSMVHALALVDPTRRDVEAASRATSEGGDRQHLVDDADPRRWYHDLLATHPPLSLRVRALHTYEALRHVRCVPPSGRT
ncbi:MAG: M48 family metalloprotease [Ilumatobacteraceae bacterium]